MRINRDGTTMLLTTHYIEEADWLCDRLAIVDQGRIVVEGTPTDLKGSVGSDTIEIALAQPDGGATIAATQAAAIDRLQGVEGVLQAAASGDGIAASVTDARAVVPALLRRLDGDGIHVAELTMREPSLDDVFLRFCGRRIRVEAADRPRESTWW